MQRTDGLFSVSGCCGKAGGGKDSGGKDDGGKDNGGNDGGGEAGFPAIVQAVEPGGAAAG